MKPVRYLVLAVAACVALSAIVVLERQRGGLDVDRISLASSPVTLWRPRAAEATGLVIVAHGYAGSRQMMQALAITLARSGFAVATFDFHGHGRHDEPMEADITSLDGATEQLVSQTEAVTSAVRARLGTVGPVTLVGHSMATDIVIRAAERIDDVAAVVAISMYSDAVTAEFPERLLIVSGAREARLREVALDRLRQLDPAAGEGETLRADDVARRAVAAPWVGHVGVLYSPTTLRETRDWIASAMQVPASGAPAPVGPWLLVLLAALLALPWPVAQVVGSDEGRADRPTRRTTILALGAPLLPATAICLLIPGGALGLAAFGDLAAFLGTWGLVQLIVLRRSIPGQLRLDVVGVALLLVWGLGIFALALDRYGAAFVPTGPRIPLMILLLAGTIPFCLADAILTRTAGWATRILARVLPLASLLAVMLVDPRLGIAFTVLPVAVLFWLVYGIAGRWVGLRCGPATSGLALGVILAWAVAASTPLVAA